MAQGRKPTPTAVKEITGNPGKRALNKSEPSPTKLRRAPEPPAHLKGLAREKWQKIAQQLIRLGVLTEIDLDALARYCVIYERWRKAEDHVAKNGEVIKTTKGNYVQNPYLAIANRNIELLNKIASEFGLTPSSRSKVHAEPPEEEEKLERELFGDKVKVKKQ